MKRLLGIMILLAGAVFALCGQDEVPKEFRITIDDRSGTLSDKSEWMGMSFGDADFKIKIVGPDPNVDYKLIVIGPAKDVDYKLIVVDPGNSREPIPENLRRRFMGLIDKLRHSPRNRAAAP